ncbi:uncharacterized protein DNG_08509 [Cephalotrichum gorgonifer]|uniref:RNA polymerase II subunit B1 CTD phosphatase RPAP2 homolog n=1 Tax=Cephalotrichum gorgonifer TaxID=2041049 RepID=A0AAE8SZ89_9PEZI|nr:uncharacterized protein DNG_08509 [Cephalotrichum gorgonifer]
MSNPGEGILKQGYGPLHRTPKQSPRQVAIQHALILEQRKKLEAQILESLITLSEYPLIRSPDHSAANPAPEDIADFKKHVRNFQPSDYDDMVIERNANGLCGYVLCPNPKKKATRGGAWKLVGASSSSFDIVDRKEHEKWCSQLCARRAAYVKVQLNETAAWERMGIPDIDIDLLPESANSESKSESEKQEKRNQTKAAKDAAALAVERGDSQTGPLLTVTLRPKEITSPPTSMDPNDPEYEEDSHLRLEGYKPKTLLDTYTPKRTLDM